MTDTIEPIDALAYPPKVTGRSPSRSKERGKTAICEKELTALTDPPEIVDVLAYTIKQSAKVVARSETRVKKAIREKELMARKDGRATVIERTELQRWVASLRTIGRDPVQEPAHVALATIARQPVQEAAHVAATPCALPAPPGCRSIPKRTSAPRPLPSPETGPVRSRPSTTATERRT